MVAGLGAAALAAVQRHAASSGLLAGAATRLLFDERAPQICDVLRTGRQGAACRRLAHDIACRHRQGRIGGGLDLAIALLVGIRAKAGVDVGQGARHIARAKRLAAGSFHGLVKLSRHRPGRGKARMGRRVVVAHPHRQGIGGAARLQDLVPAHAAADLRQAHRIARHAGRIGAEGHVQFPVVGQGAGRLGQGLLEGIGRVVGLFHKD